MKSLGFNTWLHCYLSYVAVRRVCQRGRRHVGVLQRLRQPDVSRPDGLVRAVPDGDARRPGHARGSGVRRGRDRAAQERDERLHREVAAHAGHRLHRDDHVGAAGTVESRENAHDRSFGSFGSFESFDRSLCCSSRSRCVRGGSLSTRTGSGADQDRVHGAAVGRQRAERPRHPERVPAVPGRNRLPRRRTDRSS